MHGGRGNGKEKVAQMVKTYAESPVGCAAGKQQSTVIFEPPDDESIPRARVE
jgi:hypothetical protein